MWTPQHQPTDTVCTLCGVHASRHKPRAPRPEYQRGYNKAHPRPNASARIIGIDGEGQGRRLHNYFYLAGADELGNRWRLSPRDGERRLTTGECLDWLLNLPTRSLIVGFAFNYDLTKILTDLDNATLFLLFHEKRRARIMDGRVVYRPVLWRGYSLNYINRRFTVSRDKRRATVWDIWRFFQGKFTSALIDWQVADKAKLTRMSEMKELRSTFDKLSVPEIQEYCDEECTYLAQLARRLIDAHDKAGLTLKTYFGAGSTASVFLDKLGIHEKRGQIPDGMREPVACAFFGGRFENSCVGPIAGPVWNYDIASAYPYQATFLPCLQHGVWRLSRSDRDLELAQLACVRWSIISPIIGAAWGPLPTRASNGTIAFPLAAPEGGWTWKEEFLAARKLQPNIDFREAWIYESNCVCEPPFASVPSYYRERLLLGKDAKGIVLKLGLNSGTYGKLAQSTGINPPYQSWVWAGNVTSGCRAQLLESIGLASDPWNVLMFATDGVWSKEPLDFRPPRETRTGDTAKPLGCWEEKLFPRGVFAVRPGIYFPLEPSEDALKEVRARGLGKKTLYEQWPRVVEAWEQGKQVIELGGISRFIGAKSALTRGVKSGITRSDDYGEWIDHKVNVSFDPRPKRCEQIGQRLVPWQSWSHESVPYKHALLSPEAVLMALAEQIAEEQPDADWTSYE